MESYDVDVYIKYFCEDWFKFVRFSQLDPILVHEIEHLHYFFSDMVRGLKRVYAVGYKNVDIKETNILKALPLWYCIKIRQIFLFE